MIETSLINRILLTSALTVSLLLALLAAGALKRSEIAAIFRAATRVIRSGPGRRHLLGFAEKLDRASSDTEMARLPIAGWLPREIVDAAKRNVLH